MSGALLVCLNLLARTMRCFTRYVIHPIQALSPHDAGPSIAVGLYGGVFPVPGTTLLVTVILVYFTPKTFTNTMKGVVAVVNTLSFPLEVLLLPYFFQTGGYLFDLDCDPEELIAKFNDKDTYFLNILEEFSSCLGAGALVWLVLAPPSILLLSTLITLLMGGKLSLRSTTFKDARKISV